LDAGDIVQSRAGDIAGADHAGAVMRDPDYLAQRSSLHAILEDRTRWLLDRAREAREQGCSHIRVTRSNIHRVYLVEGWKDRPVDAAGNLCEGAARFQFATAPTLEGQAPLQFAAV
jgi:hypothetical protein